MARRGDPFFCEKEQMQNIDSHWAADLYDRLSQNIENIIKGQHGTITKILAGFAAGGHILLEDNPGTGKTTLAKVLARSMNAVFKRIQFTPDLLPSDILGVSIFDPGTKQFKLHKGPVFTNILLADEINRASPRTQSALLESMAEGQVSIDGNLLALDDLFFVIATQNPIESRGTYPLPEAQMDRFTMKLKLGYISPEQEMAVLSDQTRQLPLEGVAPCVSLEECLKLRRMVSLVHVDERLKQYIVELVGATRDQPGVILGAGPRASIFLMKTAQALALFEDQDFVSPDHIQQVAVDVIAHRLLMDAKSLFSGQTPRSVIRDLLTQIRVPV